MSHLTVAAIQLTSTDDVAENLETSTRLVAEAAAAGAKLIGLPENFAYLGSDRDHRLSLAERVGRDDARGPILTRDAPRRAADGRLAAAGWFPRMAHEPQATAGELQRIRNTSVLLSPDGGCAAIYRKIHLFDVDVPGGMRFRESEAIEPGDDVVVAETPWGGLGLTICYDLRFPELYRAIAGARCAPVRRAVGVHARDRQGSLARAAARARHREPALRVRARAVRPPRRPATQLRPRPGRRSVGRGHRRVRRSRGLRARAVDFDYQDRVRRNLPCLAHRQL